MAGPGPYRVSASRPPRRQPARQAAAAGSAAGGGRKGRSHRRTAAGAGGAAHVAPAAALRAAVVRRVARTRGARRDQPRGRSVFGEADPGRRRPRGRGDGCRGPAGRAAVHTPGPGLPRSAARVLPRRRLGGGRSWHARPALPLPGPRSRGEGAVGGLPARTRAPFPGAARRLPRRHPLRARAPGALRRRRIAASRSAETAPAATWRRPSRGCSRWRRVRRPPSSC